MPDADIVIPVPGDGAGESTPVLENDMADVAESVNAQVALTAMANGLGSSDGILSRAFAASAQRRTDAADQLASDSQRMWSIAMTSPTVSSAMGFRTATESGSGRTRLEANRPAESGVADPVK